MGGTQRLTHAVGKSRSMEMCLSGNFIKAHEALDAGLVSKVCPTAETVDAALTLADQIAAKSLPSLIMAKEAIKASFEMPLTEGLRFERRLFHATFR